MNEPRNIEPSRRHLRLGCTAALGAVLLFPLSGWSAATNAPAAADAFAAFKVILQRNIFDPNRHADSDGRRRVDPAALAKPEIFSLLGTLIYSKGAYAFFGGSDANYQKVLQPSNTIADYRIVSVTPKYVELQAATNQVKLPVGMQMERTGTGAWRLMARSAAASPEPKPEASASHASPANNAADSVLKRLMEARQKELTK